MTDKALGTGWNGRKYWPQVCGCWGCHHTHEQEALRSLRNPFQQFCPRFNFVCSLIGKEEMEQTLNRSNRLSYHLLGNFPKALVKQQLSAGKGGDGSSVCSWFLLRTKQLRPVCASWPAGFGSLLLQRVQRSHTKKNQPISILSGLPAGFTLFPVAGFQSAILMQWVGDVLEMFPKEGGGKQVAVVGRGVESLHIYFTECGYPGYEQEQAESHRCALQKSLWGSSWPAQLPRSDLILKPSPAPLMWVKLFSSCLFRSCLFFT